MSGFCGLFERDGAPVDRERLRAMTAAMAYRGPDHQATWASGSAGLGHALLRTTAESAHERQPLSLDGATWIAADARIDARPALRAELEGRGRRVRAGCPDAELVLHAWHAWGEDCVAHLLGDFAFAIWDAPRRRLFGARDPLGVRPFLHTTGPRFAFGNAIDALRLAADDDAPDEEAIADFLLFEANRDPTRTGFAAIRRLAPGHVLVASRDGIATRAYWSLDRLPEIAYRDRRDYAAHLRELLSEAVEDRLRASRVAVSMSGGLDSTAIAALAKASLARAGGPFDLNAHTLVYDRIMPDDERHHSSVAAGAIGIPVTHHRGDDHSLFERFGEHAARFSEPYHGPDTTAYWDLVRVAGTQARVLLTGYDGDALMDESPRPYFRRLREQRRVGAWLAGLAGFAFAERGRLVRRFTRFTPAPDPAPPGYPAWIAPDFEKRLRLRERWAQADAARTHPVRPRLHAALDHVRRHPYFFGQFDADMTRVPVECRHPLFDLRVVAFCACLPPYPWCVRKAILREAMAGVLPGAVLRRPKTPLGSWVAADMMSRPRAARPDGAAASPGLERFVVPAAIPPVGRAGRALEDWMNLRPLSLALWLRHPAGSRTVDDATTRSRERESA